MRRLGILLVVVPALAVYGACDSAGDGEDHPLTGGSTATGGTGPGGSGGSTASGGQGGDLILEQTPCTGHAGEILCEAGVAITCAADEAVVSEQDCGEEICVPDVGCTLCIAGQFSCDGLDVRACEPGPPPSWTVVETCSPHTTRCDMEQGTCVPLGVTGTITPTGHYYQYARFTTDNSPFLGGCDVDSYGDTIYVNRDGTSIDEYEVELLDSDGDGEFEPNQHPDNPDASGPIEERVLTFVQTHNIPTIGSPNQSEIYAAADRLYFIDGSISGKVFEYIFATGVTNTVVDSTSTAWFPFLGYDETRGIWYTGTHYERRVYSFHAASNTWLGEFAYPDLSGDHMDGMELVTDPNTGVVYVYVTDMTSDFLGQYQLDRGGQWHQVNLFEYAGSGDHVEGMGFGALNHFWMNGWNPANVLYEIGGGDLAKFTEPEPEGPR